eukprot:Opistho-2@73804
MLAMQMRSAALIVAAASLRVPASCASRAGILSLPGIRYYAAAASFKTPSFVPPPPREGFTVKDFLAAIGRKAEEHANKIPSWEALWAMSGRDFKAAGIPCESRRYIMSWRNKYYLGNELENRPFSLKRRRSKKKA